MSSTLSKKVLLMYSVRVVCANVAAAYGRVLGDLGIRLVLFSTSFRFPVSHLSFFIRKCTRAPSTTTRTV